MEYYYKEIEYIVPKYMKLTIFSELKSIYIIPKYFLGVICHFQNMKFTIYNTFKLTESIIASNINT